VRCRVVESAVRSRFLQYAAVGAVATAAHYAILVGFVEAGWLAPPRAAALGAWVGAQVAFAGNAAFTFRGAPVTLAAWLRFQVTALDLNHPGGALAYRVKGEQGDFVYATDHEFGDPAFDEPLVEFARGAKELVLDAHFTPDELPLHKGWGHSDWRQCSEFAAANGIGRLWLFHHKPGRTDAALEAIRAEAQKVFASTQTACEENFFEI